MFGPAAAYLVAISAMLFSGLSALTLIYTVKHLDSPQVPRRRRSFPEADGVAGRRE